MSKPTKLKKMKLNSVDFVRRGANPAADIALYKSYDGVPDEEDDEKQSFFKSLTDSIAGAIKKAFTEEDDSVEYMDVAKAEHDLTTFTDVLGESFSSIMKDDSLSQEERIEMVQKSTFEFIDTLGDYLSSFDTLEKSFDNPKDSQTAKVTNQLSNIRKGEDAEMKIYEDVDKSLLSPEEAATLDALVAKACKTEKACGSGTVETEKACGKQTCKKEDMPAGKVNPEKAMEQEEDNSGLPPEVKKALEEVETLKKSYEMRELESIAKKYEVLGKKASEEAQTLYDLKKSGESNYNAYIAALDAQVDLVEKSGLFTEIGKSGNFNYSSVAKSEPETKVEAIAKGYMEKDPNMSYADAVAKAWENNPDLMSAYENEAGF